MNHAQLIRDSQGRGNRGAIIEMPKVLVYYYSKTGNTEKMANAVIEGTRLVPGIEAELRYYTTPEECKLADAIIIGMPTYYHDMSIDVKKMLEGIATKRINLKGKIGASFGSYGWSGEAPTTILDIMENKFEMAVIKPPLLIKGAPDERGLENCRALGRTVATKTLKND